MLVESFREGAEKNTAAAAAVGAAGIFSNVQICLSRGLPGCSFFVEGDGTTERTEWPASTVGAVMVASPQRPDRERHSKSLSPRRPGNIVESSAKAGQQQPGSAPRPTRLNQNSLDRLRRKGFPRATEVGFGSPKTAGIE